MAASAGQRGPLDGAAMEEVVEVREVSDLQHRVEAPVSRTRCIPAHQGPQGLYY